MKRCEGCFRLVDELVSMVLETNRGQTAINRCRDCVDVAAALIESGAL